MKEINKKLQKNFNELTENVSLMYEVQMEKNELWSVYLNSFAEGTNNIYKVNKEYDCHCCRHFINRFGGVVTIKNGIVNSIWDFTIAGIFEPVVKAMSDYVKTKAIRGVCLKSENIIGVPKSLQRIEKTVLRWEHLNLTIPNKFVINKKNIGEKIGEYSGLKEVFEGGLQKITMDSLLTVLELIEQGSLYKGNEWKNNILQFITLKNEYDLCNDKQKELFAWEKIGNINPIILKLKNHSMGVLLLDISNDMDLDEAVRKYEAIVAPENYQRPKEIFTKQMLEKAKNKIQEMGFLDSLDRRFATANDITVNNILFQNKDIIKVDDFFQEMEKEVAVNPKKFSKVEEISIDNFIEKVLPTTTNIEVLMENKLQNNLMSLTTAVNNCKSIFKWGNNFGWSYKGNIADSSIKRNVEKAGGNIKGILRFSIQWNDLEKDENDLDAWCYEPTGNKIYFSNKMSSSGGQLDIDIIHPKNDIAVENIYWANTNKMSNGRYQFAVHNYMCRGGKSGFRAELEVEGNIYSFNYNKPLKQDEVVNVAEVIFNSKTKEFEVIQNLPVETNTKKIWNVSTNQFIPVSLVMYSPNYWEKKIGNKHVFFMLKDCQNPENPNAFYKEYLIQELAEHGKVLSAIGTKKAITFDENQLSGIGFSDTKRNELIVKVEGKTKRILKIKF